MPIYNLIEYSDAYSETAGSLWQYHRDQPDILMITIIVLHSNLNKKQQGKQETAAQKILE